MNELDIWDRTILKDITFTEENSVQYFHYDSEYSDFMQKNNLRRVVRDKYNGYYHEGDALQHYRVAPIFDKEGNKICWGMYWPDDSCCKFKTKKEAMEMMHKVNPKRRWYDYDDEFNEYGILSDSGCTDPVGFRD